MVDLESSSPVAVSGDAGLSSLGYVEPVTAVVQPKKKRNLPGMPGEGIKSQLDDVISVVSINFVCQYDISI